MLLRVLLQVAGAREALLVKMDEFGELRLPGGLRGEVFADGSTRTLRIRDEHRLEARARYDESRGGGSPDGGPGAELGHRVGLAVPELVLGRTAHLVGVGDGTGGWWGGDTPQYIREAYAIPRTPQEDTRQTACEGKE